MAETDVATGLATDVRRVLAIRPFRKLWIALSLSSLGDWLGLLATTSLAQELVSGRSARLYAIGGVLFVRLLPALLIGPVAGAFTDRFDRRWTMVVADTIRFGMFVSIPLVHTLVWLLAASFVIESVSLFWIPAKEASVPNLVPGEQLEQANQLSLITTYGTAVVASAVFALLSLVNSGLAAAFPFFRTNPVSLALYFDAATFLFSAFTVLQLRQIARAARAQPSEATGTANLFRSVLDGWRFIAQTRWLRGVVVGILGAFAAGGAVVSLSRVFVDDLRGGNAGYGVMFGALFVGLAVGMFLGPRVLVGFSRRRLMGLAIVAAGGSLAVDALMPNLLLAILCTFLVGGFAGIAWVVGLTTVGLGVSDEMRGRTFSFMYTVIRIDLLFVLAVAPFIAGAIGQHKLHIAHVPIRADGVTLTLLGAGLFGAVVGVLCYRLMDDRLGISIWRDLVASVRRQLGAGLHTPPRGLFVVFEGGEGAGKTTQAALLADWLRERGRGDVVVTYEPGGTVVGQGLRSLLLDRATVGLSARAEALLYAADRAQHVAEVIQPALAAGAVVISDRYIDSTLAYQGVGRILNLGEVEQLCRWASMGLVPNLTVLLDVDPAVGLGRRGGAGDRLEAEPLEFHNRVREGFHALARRDPSRYLVVDGAADPEAVHEKVRHAVEQLLPPAPPPDFSTEPDLPLSVSDR